ncbi:MarR family winged helix-turn-helix transcriptional regulator [Streptosporangium saharense]|uniref:MarR family winged helix-turn-helix transcriptional regulator n=1 Tax=Streptosporangium saharense TaxID=1706840 RepID=UPI003420A8A3
MNDIAGNAGDRGNARPPTLLALPSYLAGHVSRIGHRTLVADLTEHGLRLPHFAVLSGLHDLGSITQNELADRLGLNRSHLVGYLDDLERKGLVSRTRDLADRRRQLVRLEDAGQRLAADLIDRAHAGETASLGVLSAAELATLTDLLRRVVTADDAAQACAAAEKHPGKNAEKS